MGQSHLPSRSPILAPRPMSSCAVYENFCSAVWNLARLNLASLPLSPDLRGADFNECTGV